MPKVRVIISVVCASVVVAIGAVAAAAPTVEMVLLAERNPSTSMTGRKWIDLLSHLGVGGIQLRAAAPGEKPAIESRGTKATPVYRVIGKLSGDQLILPGGQFGLSDGPKITKWLRELGENGAAGVTQQKGAFGLLAKQLADVHDDLAQPIDFSTKGMPAAQAVEKIRGQLKVKLAIDDDVEKAVTADDPVRDELNGLSCGTVLAAIARPAGAILQPQKPTGGELELMLVKSAQAAEAWPIGWPPDQSDVKVLPQLLDSLSVEIRDIPSSTAINAIQVRMKVPFVYDYNSMVKNRIDLAKKVTIPPEKKALYGTVLRKVLFQAGLKYSLRVDEAGKPLIWITTLKQ
jgi:hypothetical protein